MGYRSNINQRVVQKKHENIDFGLQVQSQLKDCVSVAGLKTVQCIQGVWGACPPTSWRLSAGGMVEHK
jgi:hypothetical protein